MPNEPLGVLPGDGWCIERTDKDGTRTVLPLAGWLVQSNGELQALPASLDNEWTVRPRVASDQGAIEATAMRLRPNVNNQNWSYFR